MAGGWQDWAEQKKLPKDLCRRQMKELKNKNKMSRCTPAAPMFPVFLTNH
jgi:hypothetical protein